MRDNTPRRLRIGGNQLVEYAFDMRGAKADIEVSVLRQADVQQKTAS